MNTRHSWIFALLLVLLLAGCGRDPVRYRWEKDILRADKLLDHREFEEARALYKDLKTRTEKPADLDHIHYKEARALEMEKKWAEAVQSYDLLFAEGSDLEARARARFRSGQILYRELGRREEAVAFWRGLVEEMPEQVGADRSLQGLLQHYKDRDLESLELLHRLYRRVGHTRLGDNLLFRRGRIFQKRGELKEAAEHFRALMERHSSSGLRASAQWHLAEVEMARGDDKEALYLLRLLSEDRDTSWEVGIYESSFADDAAFWRGLLFARKSEFEKSKKAFSFMLDAYPESILRDDALWNLAVVSARQGDPEGAAGFCAKLREKEPKSRWIDDCEALEGAGEKRREGSWRLSRSGLEKFDLPGGL